MMELSSFVGVLSSLLFGMSGADRIYTGDLFYGFVKMALFLVLFAVVAMPYKNITGLQSQLEIVSMIGAVVVLWWMVDSISMISSVWNQNGAVFGRNVIFN